MTSPVSPESPRTYEEIFGFSTAEQLRSLSPYTSDIVVVPQSVVLRRFGVGGVTLRESMKVYGVAATSDEAMSVQDEFRNGGTRLGHKPSRVNVEFGVRLAEIGAAEKWREKYEGTMLPLAKLLGDSSVGATVSLYQNH